MSVKELFAERWFITAEMKTKTGIWNKVIYKKKGSNTMRDKKKEEEKEEKEAYERKNYKKEYLYS